MRKATMIAAVVAAGVLGTGAVVTPVVLAANHDQTAQRPGPRWDDDGPGSIMGPRTGYGPRHGMRGDVGYRMHGGLGMGMGRGDREDCLPAARGGTLTSEQKQRLAEQAVLEKLSHDVYVVFAEKTGDPRFEHIARSETRHLGAVRTVMSRYDVQDPTKGLGEGELSGDASEAYQKYVAAGSRSAQAALDTARDIERKDIEGLRKAAASLEAPDVEQVYAHLLRASEMHLAAFSG